MPANENNAPEVFGSGEYDKYMLRAPTEIMTVLRGLRDRAAQITIFFNEGKDLLLTMVVALADDHLILDFGADAEINRKAVGAAKHYCVATLDKVRIQFILKDFSQVSHEGRPAFRAQLPEEVLRLQRREFYRLTTPVAHPLKCLMPLPEPGGGLHLHDANVFDISGGGMGVSLPPDNIPFAAGMLFPNCRIDLPEVGIVTCNVKVCSVFETTLKNNARIKRAGCEFAGLPGPMMTLIQRYIIKVERERKARESGLSF